MTVKKYIPGEIEAKWRQKWQEDHLYEVDLNSAQNPYYLLVELPYSSGDLHIGHWFTFGVLDIFGRFKRMQGYDVFYPMGFDAFGLPAENAAIKRNLHPRDWTLKNVETMIKQFHLMGTILDWNHIVVTCEPEYYKWNQWIFLKMLEKDIAYKGKKLSNWCPVDQTILADEQVVNGHCDRCGSEIEQKEIDQWLLKITEYAEKLEWKGNEKVDWPKSVIEGQNSWIGKSEGVLIKFDKKQDSQLTTKNYQLEVYTTRPDTLFGATFLVISPEHPLLKELTVEDQKEAVQAYVEASARKNEQERKENKEKTGVFTGSYALNPLTNQNIPIWVADYVLLSYGTGAIMAVPAHDERDFEFAKKFDLPILPVIARSETTKQSKSLTQEIASGSENPRNDEKLPYTEEGVLINSGEFTGMSSSEAREKISDYITKLGIGQRKIQYHLHDWSISRQRYWGTPIPIINCPKCGVVPVPYDDLPVELPYEVDHKPQGKPPLASNEEWMKVKCPKCGGEAQREPETMDGFVDNSWYMYRYLSPDYKNLPFDKTLAEEWMPIKVYFGGAEHTLGHTLYSRFFTKFFHDLGLTSFDEYALKRVNHGVILGPDGARMSKSRGNVVNPDEQVQNYGADAVRTYLAFIGPYDIVAPWNPDGLNGVYHFLQRVWGLQEKVDPNVIASVAKQSNLEKEIASSPSVPRNDDLKMMHKTLKKVTEDLENIKFNTAVAALMEWLNYLSRKAEVSQAEYRTLLILLAPFAPHMTEEIWQNVRGEGSIHNQPWPKVEERYLEEDQMTIVVQINGKVRDTITMNNGQGTIENEEQIKDLALKSPKVQKFLEGKEIKKTIYIAGKILSLIV